MDELIQNLQNLSKHGMYQMLPPALIKKHPELGRYSYTRRLDNKRYNWFSEKIDFNGKQVFDIGANIGYFSFRLAEEKEACIKVYEPCAAHAKAMENIRKIVGLSEERFQINNSSVAMDSVDYLPNADIILFFNIIQHAGEDYAEDMIKNLPQWRNYACNFLEKLSLKSKYLVFQMGYTWLGHKEKFVSDKAILPYTVDLLEKSNWEVKHIGIQTSLFKDDYVDVVKINNLPFLHTKSMKFIDKVLKKIGVIENDLRFKQRPIFVCQTKNP